MNGGKEPGQLAYEARFAGERPRCVEPWAALNEEARAIWVRVEDASRAPTDDRLARAEVRIATLESTLTSLASQCDHALRSIGRKGASLARHVESIAVNARAALF